MKTVLAVAIISTSQLFSGSYATRLLQARHLQSAADQFSELPESDWVGPGALECANGECEFDTVDLQYHDYVCDKCNLKDFMKLSDIELKFSRGYSSNGMLKYSGGDTIGNRKNCLIDTMKNINAKSPIKIFDGCELKCTGCTFNEFLETYSGPGVLDCLGGKCAFQDSQCPDLHHGMASASTRGWKFYKAVYKAPSDEFDYEPGEWDLSKANMDTLIHYGISTKEPLNIPQGCTVKCSGCCIRSVPEGHISTNDDTMRGCKQELMSTTYYHE